MKKFDYINNFVKQIDAVKLVLPLNHRYAPFLIVRKQLLREKYPTDSESDSNNLNFEAMQECNFLFTYYTDIYNKIRKGEIDLNILHQFLDVLKQIEDGDLDQHEGSFVVGTLLKKIYVDSALRKADKLNKEYPDKEDITIKPQVQISWKDFKRMKA